MHLEPTRFHPFVFITWLVSTLSIVYRLLQNTNNDVAFIIFIDVYISLGDVVMLQNDTISELTKLVLRQIEIPLDKVWSHISSHCYGKNTDHLKYPKTSWQNGFTWTSVLSYIHVKTVVSTKENRYISWCFLLPDDQALSLFFPLGHLPVAWPRHGAILHL